MYFSINPCSSSKRTWMYLQTLSWRSRYFVGERPSQPDMMWWMVSFSTRQIRHVSSSSILKTCFLICLVEIACSWMAAIVDSVDLFSVEDWSRYFANCPFICFLLSSASSLLIRADWWWFSAAISSSQPLVEYHGQFHHNIAVPSGG